MDMSKVLNPRTDRPININGSVFKSLIKEGYELRGDKLVPGSTQSAPSYFGSEKIKINKARASSPRASSPKASLPRASSPRASSPRASSPRASSPKATRASSPKAPYKFVPIPPLVKKVETRTEQKLSPVADFKDDFSETIRLLEKQEDIKRNATCTDCKKLVDRQSRLQPFQLAEKNILSKLIIACSECKDLCVSKHSRQGTNPKECEKYGLATKKGLSQFDRLDAQARVAGVNAARAGNLDAAQFFPSVPNTDPRGATKGVTRGKK